MLRHRIDAVELHSHHRLGVEAKSYTTLYPVIFRPFTPIGSIAHGYERCRVQLRTCGLVIVSEPKFMFQRHQLIPVTHRFLLSPPDECVNGCRCEARCAIPLRVHSDSNIGEREVVLIFILTVDVDDLSNDRGIGVDVISCPRGALHGHSDDIVGTHGLGDVSRIVVA